jgi:hypothetical protein
MSKHAFVTAAAALALLSPQAAGAAPTGYTDPSGDNGAAADIGAVTMELAPNGFLHIKTTVANVQVPSAVPASVVVAFDTDRSGSTGAIDGADYLVGVDLQGLQLVVAKWDGAQYVRGDPQGSEATMVAGTAGVEFRLRPAGIGGSTTFNFVVMAGTGNAEGGFDFDFAPDDGSWFFEPAKPVVAPVTVERISAKFVPTAPKAGATFHAPLVRLTLSNGRTIVAQKYRCVAQLGGKLLRGSGKGGCTFRLPKNARGKRLRVSLFVTYGGITDEFDPYVFKVR